MALGEDPTQGLNDTKLTAEEKNLINFITECRKEFYLSLHYNGGNSYLLINGVQIHKFKTKDSVIIAISLCLGNVFKRLFSTIIGFIGSNGKAIPLKCVSTNNQKCKTRPDITNINSNEPFFYPFFYLENKCSGSCNDINDRYAESCVPNVVKNTSLSLFNLMSRTNETCYVSWYEPCACKCRLDASGCNN